MMPSLMAVPHLSHLVGLTLKPISLSDYYTVRIVTFICGSAVHSYGKLIVHEFLITDLQQIYGPDGIGRINCTVSSGTVRFAVNGG